MDDETPVGAERLLIAQLRPMLRAAFEARGVSGYADENALARHPSSALALARAVSAAGATFVCDDLLSIDLLVDEVVATVCTPRWPDDQPRSLSALAMRPASCPHVDNHTADGRASGERSRCLVCAGRVMLHVEWSC